MPKSSRFLLKGNAHMESMPNANAGTPTTASPRFVPMQCLRFLVGMAGLSCVASKRRSLCRRLAAPRLYSARPQSFGFSAFPWSFTTKAAFILERLPSLIAAVEMHVHVPRQDRDAIQT